MPTIDDLPAAIAASDTDEIAASQGGIARKVTRAQLIAGTQPALALSQGQIVGRSSAGIGSAETLTVGANLVLSAGTLAAAAAPFDIAALPAGTTPTASDLVPIGQSGADVAVSYAQFIAGVAQLGGVDATRLNVVPTGSTATLALGDFAANTLQRSGAQMQGPLLLASDPALPTQAATKNYVDARVRRAGDTLTGPLTLAADPTQPLHAATKEYVDTNAVGVTGATMTGGLNFSKGASLVIAADNPASQASLSSTGANLVSLNRVGDSTKNTANLTSYLLTTRAQDILTKPHVFANGYYLTDVRTSPVNGTVGVMSSISCSSGSYAGADRTVENGHSARYAQMLRNAVPYGSTTVAVALTQPATTLQVADVSNLAFVYPNDRTHNGGAFPASAALPAPVQVGATVYACVGASGTGQDQFTHGPTGPGTLTFATPVSVADGAAGNAVTAQKVMGTSIWGDVIEVRSFTGLPSSVDGNVLGIEMDMSGNGADDAHTRRFLVMVAARGADPTGQGRPQYQTPYEITSFIQFFPDGSMSYKQGILFSGPGQFTQAAIDLRTAAQGPQANALWLRDAMTVAFDTAGTRQLRYNPQTMNVELLAAGVPVLSASAGGIATGVPVQLAPYRTASLPKPVSPGQIAFASDGRNPAEPAGSGTGCTVQVQSIGGALVWCALWSGVAVTN